MVVRVRQYEASYGCDEASNRCGSTPTSVRTSSAMRAPAGCCLSTGVCERAPGRELAEVRGDRTVAAPSSATESP
jgi:hypothetical protein